MFEHTWSTREHALCERHHSATLCPGSDAQTDVITDSEFSTDPVLLDATNLRPLNNDIGSKAASVDPRIGKSGSEPLQRRSRDEVHWPCIEMRNIGLFCQDQ